MEKKIYNKSYIFCLSHFTDNESYDESSTKVQQSKKHRETDSEEDRVNHHSHSTGDVERVNGVDQRGQYSVAMPNPRDGQSLERDIDEKHTRFAKESHSSDWVPNEYHRQRRGGSDDDRGSRSRRGLGGDGNASGGSDQWDKNRRDWDRSHRHRYGDRNEREDRYYDKERHDRDMYRRNFDRGRDGDVGNDGGHRNSREKSYRSKQSNHKRDDYIHRIRVRGEPEKTEGYRNKD